ncbi:site-specific integrase [Bradyrhizobium sp. 183]|uniref:tyrosine-type recombinase/integrase n=1 Tax=unclassified Bradyrhizobium TaxID=2631580 RepID=UPI001FFF53CD|nr:MULTISPECIES: tyrosine-type recombinase/integrase [unclassified Bradyrhizobium]UPJ83567.1 site-specific integrase [Bradyrhizobium sp. 184]UPJ91358.1 site-specific integrase [Bradyrhizobium sp. 183]
MTSTDIIEPTGEKSPVAKRPRRTSTILTERLCQKRVNERTKVYDRKCRGLYVSIIPAGVATFNLKFTDPATGKQRSTVLGVYNPETFGVEDARSKVYALKALDPAALVEQLRQTKTAKGKHGRTVAEIVEARIDWMQQWEQKADGEKRPRIESWENVASHLRRFVNPSLGNKIASDVTRQDIAELSNDILDGKYGRPSISNARHTRRAVSGLYRWASEAGRDYVPETCRPCFNLPKLPTEHARKRVLSEGEIRTLWHGLDRDNLPWDRRTRLAIKFELVTMLRSAELVAANRDELIDLDGDAPLLRIPAKRVKKRRVIEQPLSSLAVEIVKEALARTGQQFVFESPVYPGQPIHRTVMATALRGTKHEKCKGKTKTPGLCELLGLKPFSPHDLRRTAATLAGELGFSEAAIAKCLDHVVTKDDGERVQRVTGVYVRSKRMNQKRAVLDGIAAELRRIIGAASVVAELGAAA